MRRSEHEDYTRHHNHITPFSNRPGGHPEMLGHAVKQLVNSYVSIAEATIDTALFLILGEATINSGPEDFNGS